MPRFLTVSMLSAASAMALSACATTDSMDAGTSASTQTTATTTATPSPTPRATPTPTATPNPTVGGSEMFPTKTIVENASTASNLTTLVAAVKAAGLVETLSGPGPFTVFAPTNAAFERLAPGTVDTLLMPANKPLLTKVLTYHVVSGNLDGEAILERIQAGGGTTTFTTVAGETLTAMLENDAVVLTDVNGNKSYVTQYDVRQSNGIVHVVNSVLIPSQPTAPAS